MSRVRWRASGGERESVHVQQLSLCMCVHLSVIHSEGCFSLHKIFMSVVLSSIIAISALELFIGCTVHFVSFTDNAGNTIQVDPKRCNAAILH